MYNLFFNYSTQLVSRTTNASEPRSSSLHADFKTSHQTKAFDSSTHKGKKNFFTFAVMMLFLIAKNYRHLRVAKYHKKETLL